MTSFWQDLRLGWRMLARNPGFAVVAVLTLALGIGANTAIFSLTDQVLLRELPVPHAGQLVELRSPGPNPGRNWSDGIEGSSFSYPMYRDLRAHTANAFAGLLATFPVAVDVFGQGASERCTGELVSGNYFETLRVTPALGRLFTPEDETANGANPVVVLSFGYWTRRFSRDPGILNKTLAVNGASLTVVGVVRAGYEGIQIGAAPDLFVPITMMEAMSPNQGSLNDRKYHWAQILGRLKPGFSSARAQAAIAPAYHALLESELPVVKPSRESRPKFLAKQLLLIPGSQGRPILQIDARTPLTILLGMVGVVLLIACANLAGLLTARGESRQREMALREALGAGRGRLVRQLLTESCLLAVAGGILGLIFGSWGIHLLVGRLAQGEHLSGLAARLDARALLFGAAVAIATLVLFGLAPALRATSGNLQSPLKDQARSVAGSAAGARLRKALIVTQVAFTAILLAGSALLAESLVRLDRANLGVRTDHVLQFTLAPALDGYKPARTAILFDRVRQGAAALPGVRAVAAAAIPIFHNDDSSANITAEGYDARPDEDTNVEENYISPGYFSAMGIPLLEGREFSEADNGSGAKVAVINENLVHRFFAGRDPIGMHIAFGAGTSVHPDIRIVGVVQNSKHDDVRDKIAPFLYLPYSQFAELGRASFYVRTEQDPRAAAGELRRVIAGLDPRLPVYDVKTLAEQVDSTTFTDRLVTSLSVCFGLLATLLAAIGLYGVMAYVAARRTNEIGIRMALGAQRASVLRLILVQGAGLAAVGIVAGIAVALALAHVLTSVLYGVSVYDPAAFAGVAVALGLVAVAACYLPARRAAAVDPIVALRHE